MERFRFFDRDMILLVIFAVSLFTATGDETSTATLNWIGRLSSGDMISFQQSCTDADIGIIATPAGTPPATPSIIISIARIS